LQKAEAEMAEARIQLLQAQRAAADRANGAVLQQLNNELSTLFIQSAEVEEKMKAMGELIQDLQKKSNTRAWAEIQDLNSRLRRIRNDQANVEASLKQMIPDPQGAPPPEKVIAIRPLEEALLGEDGEGADAGARPRGERRRGFGGF
jgi:hypothetical protein